MRRKREKTVDNIGMIAAIQLDEFPNMVIKRYSMLFASPWDCTGEPAQANEFWLELIEFEDPFTTIIKDISPTIKECIKKQSSAQKTYYGKAYYVGINEEPLEFKIKCIFHIETVMMTYEDNSYALSKNFKVKVDLYHEWKEEEIDRFQLMEFEE